MEAQPKLRIFISSTNASQGKTHDFVTYLNTPINVGFKTYCSDPYFSYMVVDQLIVNVNPANISTASISSLVLCSNIVKTVQFGAQRAERIVGFIPPPIHGKTNYPEHNSGIRAELENGYHPSIRMTLKKLLFNGDLVPTEDLEVESISMILSFI